MHVFKFSPRRGTKAESMPNQINGDIKEKRSKALLELSDKNEIAYQKAYLEKKVKVLFEEKDGDFYKGHTENYIMVKAKSEEDLSNRIVEVIIENVDEKNLELLGNVIN